MRRIGLLALAGFALVGFLSVSAPAATAQVASAGASAGTAVGHTAIPDRPRVDMPHPTLRLVGVPSRGPGAGEDSEARTSVTAIVPQPLAGATWRITRHVGLFFDYKLRSHDAAFSIWNAPSDMSLKVNHVFGGITFDF